MTEPVLICHTETYSCLIGRDSDGRITSLRIDATDLEGRARSVRVDGYRAAHLAAPLQHVLRGAGLRGRDWTSRAPINLEPDAGAHAELMVHAVKPLDRIDRITAVADAVSEMSQEEALYWHAQAQRRHGLKALRVLLDGGS